MATQPFHTISSVFVDNDSLIMAIDGQRLRCPLTVPALLAASPEQLKVIEISPSGYGLYWPLLDVDLAIEPLLQSAQAEAA
jgi:hypothetical protein